VTDLAWMRPNACDRGSTELRIAAQRAVSLTEEPGVRIWWGSTARLRLAATLALSHFRFGCMVEKITVRSTQTAAKRGAWSGRILAPVVEPRSFSLSQVRKAVRDQRKAEASL
jgi:hypothetical protein